MRIEANALKVKNLVAVVLCGLIIPIARVLDRHAASAADSAAWLTPFVAAVLFVPYAFILKKLTDRYPDTPLDEIHRLLFGKAVGNVINTVYLVWFLFLSGYYLCQFGERMATTVFYNTNSAVFISVMLLLLSLTLRFGQETVLRACGMFFYAVAAVFLLSLLLLVKKVNIEYHLPVTPSIGVISGGLQIFSVLTYFVTVPFFFGDIKSEKVGKNLFVGGGVALLFALFGIFVIVGCFSAPLVAAMPYPFFSAIKEITIFQSIERIEAIIISVMVLSDFVIVVYFVLCGGRTAKNTFSLKGAVPYDLLLLAVFVISLFFSYQSVRLNEISSTLMVPVNLIIGGGLPVLSFVMLPIKRKIPA